MKRVRVVIAVAVLGFIWPAMAAFAAVTVNFYQSGPDVVAVLSGSANISGLTYMGPSPGISSQMIPSSGVVSFNPPGAGGSEDYYDATAITGPSGYGSGGYIYAPTDSGTTPFDFEVGNILAVPQGYVSGTPLSASMTFPGTTLAARGLTIGTYTWTWGAGATADSLTIIIGAPPATAVPMLPWWGYALLAALLVLSAAHVGRGRT